MTRDIIKLAIHSYIMSSFIYRIEKYVKDKWECRKSAAVRCCLSLSPGSTAQLNSTGLSELPRQGLVNRDIWDSLAPLYDWNFKGLVFYI